MAYIDTNFIHLKENQLSDKEFGLQQELAEMQEELEESELCEEMVKEYKERIEEIKFELLALTLCRS